MFSADVAVAISSLSFSESSKVPSFGTKMGPTKGISVDIFLAVRVDPVPVIEPDNAPLWDLIGANCNDCELKEIVLLALRLPESGVMLMDPLFEIIVELIIPDESWFRGKLEAEEACPKLLIVMLSALSVAPLARVKSPLIVIDVVGALKGLEL